MDDERLKNLGGGNYWKELLDRIRDIRSSGGTAVTVSDDEIIDAIGLLGRNEGVFAEPAAAASVAALRKLADSGDLRPADRVAVLITGNGLKDVQNALRVSGTSIVVPASIDAVTAAVANGF